MPKIIRWFRVTHDINQDPEMWELRIQFGDRAGFVWLECLSIADRNEGLVGPNSSQLHAVLASKCRVYSPKVRAILGWLLDIGWLIDRDGLRVAKWLKYNASRKLIESPPRLDSPRLPILTNLKNAEPASPVTSLQSLPPKEKSKTLDSRIKTWADQIYQIDTKKYNRLITWIKAAERTYPTVVIATSLEKFLLFAREVADWWPYLDKILDKEEARYNGSHTQQESDRIKRQERIWLKG